MAEFDRAIPPGGVGQITLRVNTTNYQGKITKSARVSTNDPNHGSTSIYLSMDVRPHIVVKPAPRVVLNGIVGEEIRRVLEIRASDDQPFEITSVETNLGASIEYNLSRIESGQQYRLEVRANSESPKTSSGFLKLLTNHPRKKELKLLVHVRVRPELEVRPNRITFDMRSNMDPKRGGDKRVVTIVNNRGKGFRLEELKYNREYFDVRPLTLSKKSSRSHRLEVVPFMDRLPAGRVRFEDTLVIKTDVAHAAALEVPISVRLER